MRRYWPSIGHQCAHRVGETQKPGATLCVLRGLRPDGEVRDLLGTQLPPGGVGRFDLSFDARRIVFPYAAPRPAAAPYRLGFDLVPYRFRLDDGPGGLPGRRAAVPATPAAPARCTTSTRSASDGSGLRQVVDCPYAEDTEPCYLPDGRICFTSSRDGRLVQCGDWALVNALYTVNPDGSDPRRITEPKEGEFYPAMLDDGRIIYTRWDYVMKPFNMIQQLWTVRPDGRGAELAYGDHYTFSPGPIAFFEARQVPGEVWVVCNGAAHHNTGGGPVMLVDLNRNRGGPDGMRNLTPEVGYPERGPAGMGGWFSSPYPLALDYFLVCYSLDQPRQRRARLRAVPAGRLRQPGADLSRSGPVVLLADAGAAPAAVPRAAGRTRVADARATVAARHRVRGQMSDAGLPGVPRGTAKYLRILESHNKQEYCRLMYLDLGLKSGTDPAERRRAKCRSRPTARSCVRLPPRRHYFFELLDADHLEIRRMKNYLTLQPGETRRLRRLPRRTLPPAAARPPLALRKPPVRARAAAVGRRPDRLPARRPAGAGPPLRRAATTAAGGPDKSFDLRGRQWVSNQGAFSYGNLPNLQSRFSDSYRALMPLRADRPGRRLRRRGHADAAVCLRFGGQSADEAAEGRPLRRASCPQPTGWRWPAGSTATRRSTAAGTRWSMCRTRPRFPRRSSGPNARPIAAATRAGRGGLPGLRLARLRRRPPVRPGTADGDDAFQRLRTRVLPGRAARAGLARDARLQQTADPVPRSRPGPAPRLSARAELVGL